VARAIYDRPSPALLIVAIVIAAFANSAVRCCRQGARAAAWTVAGLIAGDMVQRQQSGRVALVTDVCRLLHQRRGRSSRPGAASDEANQSA